MRSYASNCAPITERHVQAIWYDAALRPSELRTVRGGTVSVVDPGEWNLAAGPDFRHAVLELGRDRQRMVGDGLLTLPCHVHKQLYGIFHGFEIAHIEHPQAVDAIF